MGELLEFGSLMWFGGSGVTPGSVESAKLTNFTKLLYVTVAFLTEKPLNRLYLEFSIKYSIFAMFSNFWVLRAPCIGRHVQQGRHFSGRAPFNYVMPLFGGYVVWELGVVLVIISIGLLTIQFNKHNFSVVTQPKGDVAKAIANQESVQCSSRMKTSDHPIRFLHEHSYRA